MTRQESKESAAAPDRSATAITQCSKMAFLLDGFGLEIIYKLWPFDLENAISLINFDFHRLSECSVHPNSFDPSEVIPFLNFIFFGVALPSIIHTVESRKPIPILRNFRGTEESDRHGKCSIVKSSLDSS